MQEVFTCNNISDLNTIGSKLLEKYPNKRIFAFFGEMGAGKTTFIKTICAQLGITDEVTSPTFSIINEYLMAGKESLFHFDFYRIKSLEEAYDMGYEDYFFSGSYCFIEWPEKIEKLLPDDTVEVVFKVDKENYLRRIQF
ncbi:MAG: tRNA (adenosine(37)-N6)-threonylcarbamoyltransferase complex ATPase subunit type 1 TsaE [Bacteroidetes bacterium]|nr:MAG: tRNA (adenosine(37)-N6)-threonylcarbamoyltransferase complex ATPase subunit type 1 TsaE [Bacteroidota bacterium]